MGNSSSVDSTNSTNSTNNSNLNITSDKSHKKQHHTKHENDIIFCNNYICALLLLKDMPIIGYVKTYGDMMAYIHGRELMLSNFDNINYVTAYVYEARDSTGAENFDDSYVGEKWIKYTYNQNDYKCVYQKKRYPKVIRKHENYYYGLALENSNEGLLLFKSLMAYFLTVLDSDQEKRVYGTYKKTMYSLTKPNKGFFELLRNKIKHTISEINLTVIKQTDWKNNQDQLIISERLNEHKTNLKNLKEELELLENKYLSFYDLLDEEYIQLVEDIKLNNHKQIILAEQIKLDEKLIKSLDDVENFCTRCKFQIKILQHFLFVTSWCDRLELDKDNIEKHAQHIQHSSVFV